MVSSIGVIFLRTLFVGYLDCTILPSSAFTPLSKLTRACPPNIKDAASQLGAELDKPGRENDYGIVAISLSRIFTKGE